MTLRQSQGHWEWYKMVEINGVNNHDKYERIWLKGLCVMSNIDVIATQDRWTGDLTMADHRLHDLMLLTWIKSRWRKHRSIKNLIIPMPALRIY